MERKMDKAYKILNRFECCGERMVTVIMDTNTVSVMPLKEFEWIVQRENQFLKQHKGE